MHHLKHLFCAAIVGSLWIGTAAAQDRGWSALGTLQGRRVVVLRRDGANVRGLLLRADSAGLDLGGNGMSATVPRGDVVTVTHVRKSYWWAWLLGGVYGGYALGCATTSDFGSCMTYGPAYDDQTTVYLIQLACTAGGIAGAVLMGTDRTVYPAAGASVSVLPAGQGRIGLALTFRH